LARKSQDVALPHCKTRAGSVGNNRGGPFLKNRLEKYGTDSSGLKWLKVACPKHGNEPSDFIKGEKYLD
jgi:hypothetical protein